MPRGGVILYVVMGVVFIVAVVVCWVQASKSDRWEP